VNNSIKKWYRVVIEPYIKDVKESLQSYRYGREIAVLFMVVLLGMAGFWGYRRWHSQREATAQKAFGECIYAYQLAMQGKGDFTSDELSWGEVAMMFNFGYEQHSSSSLAPYFLVFYADALLRKGDRGGALSKLDEAIKALPADSPFLNLYKTKQALLKLDDDIQEIKEEGLQELEVLADNVDNKNRDMALYYFGLYYWSDNKTKEAQAIWQQLVGAFKHEKVGASPWASLASTKLEQIAGV